MNLASKLRAEDERRQQEHQDPVVQCDSLTAAFSSSAYHYKNSGRYSTLGQSINPEMRHLSSSGAQIRSNDHSAADDPEDEAAASALPGYCDDFDFMELFQRDQPEPNGPLSSIQPWNENPAYLPKPGDTKEMFFARMQLLHDEIPLVELEQQWLLGEAQL